MSEGLPRKGEINGRVPPVVLCRERETVYAAKARD